jgi:hemolysin activation/secretion protein
LRTFQTIRSLISQQASDFLDTILLLTVLLLVSARSPQVQAQTPPIPPQIPELPELPEELPEELPADPLQVPETIPTPPTTLPEVTVVVEDIRVLGNTVFSEEEIAEVTRPFVGQEAAFADLLAIRTAITNLYVREGYTTSGAFLPPQDVTNGVITVQVVEGELERIEITGLDRLEPGYVRSRLERAGRTPVNIRQLEETLQLLQLNPLFTRIQAELKAGTAPGQSVLTLDLAEADPFDATYVFSNEDSPSVGSLRNAVILTHRNLAGFGDRFQAEVGFTEGTTEYRVDYTVPVTPRNTTVNFNFSKGDQLVIEDPFAPLDLNSETDSYSLGINHPLIYTPTEELSLGLAFDLRRSQTFFDGMPFSFSIGPEDGESKVSVLRFSQDWIRRSPNRVIAARSRFSFGVDVFDATVNNTGTDGRFFSWLGQAQWVQALNPDGVVAVTRLTSQLTPDSLLPLEQFSIGGVNTVRGYRQNQRVADNGIVGSVEVRFPLFNNPEGGGVLQVIPFFDVGTVWENQGEVTNPQTLIGTGLGLRWQYKLLSINLDWGIALNEVDSESDSLQDQGLYFSLRFQPF